MYTNKQLPQTKAFNKHKKAKANVTNKHMRYTQTNLYNFHKQTHTIRTNKHTNAYNSSTHAHTNTNTYEYIQGQI